LVTFLKIIVGLGLLVLPQTVIAGEIFPYEDPETGSRTYTLKQGDMVVRVSPSNGANVFSIEVAGSEYLAAPPDMHDFFGLFYGTPVLYPTPNRVRNARFTFEGKEYAFTPNLPPDRIHGLVFDADWEVIGIETTKVSAAIKLALDFREGTELYESYPFPHRIALTIEVKADSVRWTYDVDNTEGNEPVAFGFGLHPNFLYQGAREGTYVTIPASHKMEAVDQFPTGRLIPASALDYSLGEPISLQGRNFDDVFWGLSHRVPAVIDFRDAGRQVTISASDSFSHVVLYSPERPFFSVEHQTSSTDAHNLHAAGKIDEASLRICPPGETRSGWVEYGFGVAGDIQWVFEDEGFKLSLQHCESCHGFAFTGARARSLWGGEWQYAESEADIFRVIADGIPGTEMPAFGDVLDDARIESLASLIVRLLKDYPREMTAIAMEASHDRPRQSYRETFRLESVVDGLEIPWSFAFLPDGRIVLTERNGRLRLVDDGTLSEPIRGTPRVRARQDGGLFAIALDPDYEENDWVYLSLADPGDKPDTSMTKIVRGRIVDNAWADEEVIWQAPSSFYTESNVHYGTRLLLEGEYLYFPVGDRGQRDKAQDLSSPFGKLHRIYRDGRVPADNPFIDRAGAYPSIWSFGHRNPQGLALSPDGALWSTEHGPTGGDELNEIEAARNYGWPLATHGTEMDGSPISANSSLPGIADPVHVWPETIAPSNIAFYAGRQFPGWRGSLFVASLAGQELRRIEIENGVVTAQELLLNMIGRIRDVKESPDGYLYLAVERYGGHGGILRLVPASIPSPALETGNFRMD
jgi:glucose/arabinose dehydrogenase/galactose mutarotase-like enzyme